MKYYTVKQQKEAIKEADFLYDIGLSEESRLIKDFANEKRIITKANSKRRA